MKQLFLCLTGIVIIVSSCMKYGSESLPGTNPLPSPEGATHTLNLNANNWKVKEEGTFVCAFPGVLKYTNANYITVFLDHDGVRTEIPNSGISYKNGVLKSWINDKDLSLTYEPGEGNSELPFSSLDIKLVFQQ